MLSSTFMHIKKFGERKEKLLWGEKIFSWDAYAHRYCNFLPFDDECHNSIFSDSKRALSDNNTDFFATRLPKSEFYRIALEYAEKTIFFDLETTGLSTYYDSITMAGWSIAGEYGAWVAGQDPTSMYSVLKKSKVIITFNGTLFDLKFMRKHHPNCHIPHLHIDLRFFARTLGFSGGQKKIEKEVGFTRPKGIEEVNGAEAVNLWHEYVDGDLASMRKLMLYNYYDVEGMKFIFDTLIDCHWQKKGFPEEIKPKNVFRRVSSIADVEKCSLGLHQIDIPVPEDIMVEYFAPIGTLVRAELVQPLGLN